MKVVKEINDDAKKEIDNMKGLQHENVTKYFESFQNSATGFWHIVTDYCHVRCF